MLQLPLRQAPHGRSLLRVSLSVPKSTGENYRMRIVGTVGVGTVGTGAIPVVGAAPIGAIPVVGAGGGVMVVDGRAGAPSNCEPLTLPAGPGAMRVPPGAICSRSSPGATVPGATGTLPTPIPPMPMEGGSAPGAIGLVRPRFCAEAAVASPSSRAATAAMY